MTNFKTQKMFPNAIVFFGYLILILSIFVFIDFRFLVGIMLVFFGGLFAFSFTGVMFDIEKQRFKEYSSYFGIKVGKWKKLEEFPYIGILTKNLVQSTSSLSQNKSKTRSQAFDICLMSENHRIKIPVKRFFDKEKATFAAEKMEVDLPVKLAVYSPR
ncbi:hypothetical protein [Aureivirga sp. CE67]|uniref:hypothetical protein n=1 Tax=Aureivirga sp. CE67 TaxID=1788983 RepID=UPI0018CB28B5|nr:hypothetical protein [Aureivirga sp. CE67]